MTHPLDELKTYWPDLELVRGQGDWSEHQACIVSAMVALERLRAGVPLGEATDETTCASQVLRELIIQRNDATPVEDLDAWAWDIVPRWLDAPHDDATEQARAEWLARYAVREIAPRALDAAGLTDEAARLRALPADVSMAEAAAAARAAEAAEAAAEAAEAAAEAAAARAAAAAAAAAARAAWAAKAAARSAWAAWAAEAAADHLATLDHMIEQCLAITEGGAR